MEDLGEVTVAVLLGRGCRDFSILVGTRGTDLSKVVIALVIFILVFVIARTRNLGKVIITTVFVPSIVIAWADCTGLGKVSILLSGSLVSRHLRILDGASRQASHQH